MTSKRVWLLAFGGILISARAVRAQDYAPQSTTSQQPMVVTPVVEEDPYGYEWNESRLATGVGVGVVVGGGIAGFTDRSMRDSVTSDIGGLWDVRATFGTHIPIGLDVAYIGTAENAQSVTGFSNGTLIGTTAEAALRFNILPHYMLDPYVFAGAGWQRYDVNSRKLSFADTGMQSSDNVAEFPLGGGISYRDMSGFTVDLRGTFRPTTSSTLLLDPRTGNYADLHTWEASAGIGYEF